MAYEYTWRGRTLQCHVELLRGNDGGTVGCIGIGLDVRALVAGPRLRTHAKTGEPYDAGRRLRDLTAAEAAHRSEIEMVATWAGQVAQAVGLTLDLPIESAL